MPFGLIHVYNEEEESAVW